LRWIDPELWQDEKNWGKDEGRRWIMGKKNLEFMHIISGEEDKEVAGLATRRPLQSKRGRSSPCARNDDSGYGSEPRHQALQKKANQHDHSGAKESADVDTLHAKLANIK
jgi:hypothetical protein